MRYAAKRSNCIEYAICTGYDMIENRITFDHTSKFTRTLFGMSSDDIAINTSPVTIIHIRDENSVYVRLNSWFCCKKEDLIQVQQCTGMVDGRPVFDNDPNNMRVTHKDFSKIKLNSWLMINGSTYKIISPVRLKNNYRLINKIEFI